MDGHPTRAGSAALAPAAWRGFFAFLRRPTLPDRASGMTLAGIGAVARLFALDLLLMTLLIGAIALLTVLGLELPEHALENLELGPALIAFILIGAPIGEELVFRSWLSGRPGHVWSVLLPALAGGGAFVATRADEPPTGVAALAGLVAGLALVLLLLWRLRRRPAWGWFQRRFRWFYFASALAFAAIHLFNFGEGATAAMLPLVLPQLVLGLMLGYIRVIHGLWAGVLLHALHNAVFIGLVLAASSAA